MPSRKVLFVLKYRERPYEGLFDGWGDHNHQKPFLHSGLYNSANFVCKMLNDIGIESKLVHVPDNNAIHREVVLFQATDVIIEAFWVVPEKFDVLYNACPNVRWIIRNHSEVPFLQMEGIAFDWMMKYLAKPNVFMSSNSPRMTDQARFLASIAHPEFSQKTIEAKTPYLPNFYPVFPYDYKVRKQVDQYLDVGMFGAIRPLKNPMMQAIAALKVAESLGKQLRLHINSGRVEQKGDPVLKNLIQLFEHMGPKHQLVHQPWRPHEEFKSLIQQMDLVAQVTFTETFNIVAADAVSCYVPTITSPEVPWMPATFTADPTNCDDIVEKFKRVLWVKNVASWLNLPRRSLLAYNQKTIDTWQQWFTQLPVVV